MLCSIGPGLIDRWVADGPRGLRFHVLKTQGSHALDAWLVGGGWHEFCKGAGSGRGAWVRCF